MLHHFGILEPLAQKAEAAVITPLTALRQKPFFGGFVRQAGNERPTAAECDAAYLNDKSPTPFDRNAAGSADRRFVSLVMPPYI